MDAHEQLDILLVEDDKVIRVTTQRLLQKSGYTVLAAETPDEALRQAAEHGRPIHLLLTDVVLPGMTGRDLAARLRAQEVCPARGGEGGADIHHHARGDQLGAEIAAARVMAVGRGAGDRNLGARPQAALGLEAFEGEAVSKQQHIRAGAAGSDLGAEARHDLRRAGADPLHVHLRVKASEGLDGPGGIGLKLAGVQDEIAADGRLGPRHMVRGQQEGGCPEEMPAPHLSLSAR
jgi:CheY-like chemotaxis protein